MNRKNNIKYLIILSGFVILIMLTMYIYYDGVKKYNDYKYKSAKNVNLLVAPSYDELSCSENDCNAFLAVNHKGENSYYKVLDDKGKIVNEFSKEHGYKSFTLHAYYNNYYIIKETEKNCKTGNCNIYNVYKKEDLVASFKDVKAHSDKLIYAVGDSNKLELYDASDLQLKGISNTNLKFYKDTNKLFASSSNFFIDADGKLVDGKIIIKEFKTVFGSIEYFIIKDIKTNTYSYLGVDNKIKGNFDSYFIDEFNNRTVVNEKGVYYYLDSNGSLSNGIKKDYYNVKGSYNYRDKNILLDSLYNSRQKAYIILNKDKCFIKNYSLNKLELISSDCKDKIVIKKLSNNFSSDFIALVSFKGRDNSFIYNFNKAEYLYRHDKVNDFIEEAVYQNEYLSLGVRDKNTDGLYQYYLYNNNELVEKNSLGLTGVYNIDIKYGTKSSFDYLFDTVDGIILNNENANIFEMYNNRSNIRVIDNKEEVLILNDNNYTKVKGKLENINNVGINIVNGTNYYYNFFDEKLYELKLKKDETIKNRSGAVIYPFRNAFFINNFKKSKAKILDKNMDTIYEGPGEIISVYNKHNASIIIHFKAHNGKRGVLIIR